jgi:hypothetical protein
MSDVRLGFILPATGAPPIRDAVHVPVCEVLAGEELLPGQEMAWREGEENRAKHIVVPAIGQRVIGMVDPWLPHHVTAGQRCFVLLRPGSITTLRHVWEHPSYDKPQDVADAILRLTQYAMGIGYTFEHMIELCDRYQAQRGDWPEPSVIEWRFESMSLPVWFWADYTLATGSPAPHGGAFFSCGGCSEGSR